MLKCEFRSSSCSSHFILLLFVYLLGTLTNLLVANNRFRNIWLLKILYFIFGQSDLDVLHGLVNSLNATETDDRVTAFL